MKLLIDENLSCRLAGALADLFPSSVHVRDVALKGANDTEIWKFAIANGYTILTKDIDFQSRALMSGPPAKVILVSLGNCSTTRIEIVLRSSVAAIGRFEEDQTAAVLVLP